MWTLTSRKSQESPETMAEIGRGDYSRRGKGGNFLARLDDAPKIGKKKKRVSARCSYSFMTERVMTIGFSE